RAAEQRRVDRQGRAFSYVAHLHPGPVDHAQVRLVRIALLDHRLRGELRRRQIWLRGGKSREAGEQVAQLVLRGYELGVPHQERSTLRPGPAALPEAHDRLARKALEVLLRSEHRASQWMVAEGGLVDQVLGHGRRLVIGPVDL